MAKVPGTRSQPIGFNIQLPGNYVLALYLRMATWPPESKELLPKRMPLTVAAHGEKSGMGTLHNR